MVDLLTINKLSGEEVTHLIDLAIAVKSNPKEYSNALKNKTLAMLFQKTSTRTRCSFETAMTQLGGHAQYLFWETTNLTLGSLKDEIKCIAGYCDAIMARVYKHEDILAIAEASRVPVINGLCNLYHPCQALGDLMTIKENLGTLKGKKLAYVGDGNNVCNSLILGCSKVGMMIAVATPKGYEPVKHVLDSCAETGLVIITNNPLEAVKEADVVYTDTWVSMGQEEETKERMKVFPPYQVNKELLKYAPNVLVMHCLPAHRGLEITDEVIDSEKSIVFDQAENRLYIQKAILLWLMKNE